MADAISKAFTGKGTVYSIGTPITTPVYTAVSELKTYSFSGSKNDTVDVTNSDSAGRTREKIVTLLDPGEISISGNYVAGDAGQIAFRAALNSGLTLPHKIVLPLAPTQTTTGDTFTFLGIVSENNLDLSFDKEVSFSAKVAITGVITYVQGS